MTMQKHVKVQFSLREDQVEAIYKIASQRALEQKTYKSDISEVLRGIVDLVLSDTETKKQAKNKGGKSGNGKR